MTVYNYVRVGAPGGEASIHDAPPEVAAAIETWLEGQDPAESGKGVTRDRLPEPGLGLLVLRHAISSDDRYTLGLVHVVAVPERDFAEPSPAALGRFFESLYGSPLAIALSKLLGALAATGREETAARVQEGFAGDEHLEALAFGSEGSTDILPPAPQPVAEPAAGDGNQAVPEAVNGSAAEPEANAAPPPPRRSARFAAGLGLLGAALGIALAFSPFADRILPGLDSPAPQTQKRLDRLEQRVDRLQEESRATRSAFTELERSHADAVSQLRQGLEALKATATAAAAAPAPDPKTAAAPAVTRRRAFRVVARSARVRAGPSAKDRTRGLLARGQRVLVTDQQDAWLEIEPPPGFRAPSWIHRTLVEAVEAPAGEAARAAPTGPPPA